MLAHVEDDIAQVGEDVDHDHDQRGDRAQERERVQRTLQGKAEDDRDDDPERTLDVNGDIRRLETRVNTRERSRQNPDAAECVTDTGRGVGAGVGVRKGAVDDGEQHEDRERSPDLRGQTVPRVAAVEVEEAYLRVGAAGLERTEVDHRAVVAHEVEHADQHAREDHGARDRPLRILGLLAQRGRRLEADEGQHRVHHPGEQ